MFSLLNIGLNIQLKQLKFRYNLAIRTACDCSGRKRVFSCLATSISTPQNTFDFHVAMHRDKFLIIKPTRCTNFSEAFNFGMKLYMFRAVSLSIIRSFTLYIQQWCVSYSLADSLQTGSGWNCSSILMLLASCQQTCMI